MTTDDCAKLVESMIPMPLWEDKPWGRLALTFAARAIRRGRHLTDTEKMANVKAALTDFEGAAASVGPFNVDDPRPIWEQAAAPVSGVQTTMLAEIEHLKDALTSFVIALNAGSYRGLLDAARQARKLLGLKEDELDLDLDEL